MLGLGEGVLAMLGLPPCRLPAANLPVAFGFLAVALVPTLRLVPTPASFAQADPQTRSASSGLRAVLSLNVMGAHGRVSSHGKSSGRMHQHSPRGAIKTRTRRFGAV